MFYLYGGVDNCRGSSYMVCVILWKKAILFFVASKPCAKSSIVFYAFVYLKHDFLSIKYCIQHKVLTIRSNLYYLLQISPIFFDFSDFFGVVQVADISKVFGSRFILANIFLYTFDKFLSATSAIYFPN